MSALLRSHTRRIFSNKPLFHGVQFFRTSAAAVDSKQTGLYGFPHLKNPQGFQRFVDDAIDRSGELISYIASNPSSVEVIRAMDEISDTVCSVVDSAELCRHTHPDREFVEQATAASIRMDEYLHVREAAYSYPEDTRQAKRQVLLSLLSNQRLQHLNTNYTLYQAVARAEQDGNVLNKEAHRAAHYLRVDFERGGIHLCSDKLDRVNQLNMDIAQLSRMFTANIVEDPGCVDIYPATRIPKRLHHLVKPIYRPGGALSTGSDEEEKGFRIATDPISLSSVLQCASDAEVRKLAYIRGNSMPDANLDVIEKIIAARDELAQIMGCNSYAEFAVRQNMASSSDVVMAFLNEMSNMVRPKADEEFRRLRDFKRAKTGHMFEDLEPWDETYYSTMMKASNYNLDSSVIAAYFPLVRCIEGLKLLVESLFGATFHSIPFAPGESWHPDVLKMSLHHAEEGDLGFLYLDLYSRKDKYTGCAHFAIKGGRRISEAEYQLPAVALVCNFSNSSDRSSARLNHGEVETLFHEFGHALHSLLSRTEYQHFSGTRVALDLAETPSNLFEYYAWDYRFLKKFARHYSTGEVIPEKLVKSMQGARTMFAATELQRQIFYSLIDQNLFGKQDCPPRDSIAIVADLKRQHTSYKQVEGTHWHTRFSHLLNYGGGYYSYLYAKCLAATIWKNICQEDPLSIDTGTALRTKFLQHGGAVEPLDLLKDLAGDGSIKYVNGGVIPDIRAVCEELKLG